ncbi:MAG: hypothetical protein AAFW73_25365 [Bacteroidota bacterium]
MNTTLGKEEWTLIVGGLTLLLFAAAPYLLDLIEPAKSIGQIIGENAKDLMDSVRGDGQLRGTHSKRAIWSNLLTITSFALFVLAMTLSIQVLQSGTKKWYGLGGGLLAIAGLGVYWSYLAIGLVGAVIIAIVVLVLVIFWGG